MDPSKNIIGVHKTVGTLARHTRKLVIRVNNLEKTVNNQAKKITSLKNISKNQSTRISGANIGAKLPGGKADNVNENIKAITNSLTSIAQILAGGKKLKSDTAAFDRRKAEQDKRALAESKLEKRFDGLKKIAEKIIAPVKNILDRIIDFLVKVFLGRVIFKLIEWFGDPKNASKVKSIIRFIGDFWPALLSAYILFGTSFGGLIRFTLGWVARLSLQIGRVAIPALLRLVAANPVASLIIGGTAAAGVGAYAASRQNEQKREGVKPGEGTPNASQLQREQTLQRGLGGMFAGGGFVIPKFFGGGANAGYVSGEKGVDKVPAMLTDGEFVMSAGAVQTWGLDTLEAMNAAGGGTNKPRVIRGTTFAQGGGSIGEIGDDRKRFIDIYNWFASQGINPGDPKTYGGKGGTGVRGGSTPSSGGGVTGFLNRVPGEAQKLLGGLGGSRPGGSGRGSTSSSSNNIIDRVRRVPGEAQKLLSGLGGKPKPKPSGGGKPETRPSGGPGGGFDFSGLKPFMSTLAGATQEAVPALLASTLGLSRTDTSISQDMQKQILDAMKKAKKAGKDVIDYSDYGSGTFGGRRSAAGLTMGKIGMNEFKRDEKGRIIGLRQIYDTNTTVEAAMKEAKKGREQFKSSLFKKGKLDFNALMLAAYKPAEALLAATQHRGMTMHDVNFDEKLLGYKPGKEVLNDTQRRMIAAQKNREALQSKRPFYDLMGRDGGASRVMQNEARERAIKAGASGQYGRYAAPSTQTKFTSSKPKPSIAPPVQQKPNVTVVNTRGGNTKRRGQGSGNGSKVPNIPIPKPSSAKAAVQGRNVRGGR